MDFNLLAALQKDTVNFLVTEDRGIHTKSATLGIKNRVLNIAGAIYFLQGFISKHPPPPPDVKCAIAHTLNQGDPIFNTLRADYPGFDEWLRKCRLEHRDCWVIEDRANDRIAGLCLINDETKDMSQYGVTGKILKLCTFKVSEDYGGRRYGELLLKAAFAYADVNSYDWIFVTVLPKYPRPISFFSDFGFSVVGQSRSGELLLFKSMRPLEGGSDTPLEFHRKYGPYNIDFSSAQAYLVPIKPVYHNLLFPELDNMPGLFDYNTPFGNSIRKAYLSNSQIRRIEPGAIVFFYRSHDLRKITTIGVVENTKISVDPDEIACFVGKRTVYSYQAIKDLSRSEVLSILFRQAFNLNEPIGISGLIEKGFLGGPPQSISSLSEPAKKCLLEKIKR